MAARGSYEELARHLSGIGAVRREMSRGFPADCPPASAAVLALLHKYGEMRMSRLAELMVIDMSVTSRHVAHTAERGWVERLPDPRDGRSRLLCLTERGRRQLDTLSEATTEALESFLHDWTDDDIARLNGMLARLRESFGDCRARVTRQDTPHPAARHCSRK
ncbi:MAG: MarR family winged helix-turn-helix transcriptional regulator [Streptomyces sp.]|uniref:MarR family winged helix-turn-helix transcriptional regulator n=1 Tax=Streptomyces sp. TaxID=1931 RepID=UPI003D6BF8B8